MIIMSHTIVPQNKNLFLIKINNLTNVNFGKILCKLSKNKSAFFSLTFPFFHERKILSRSFSIKRNNWLRKFVRK